MIPQEAIDRVLDLTRIEEVIGDFVSLKRQGANYLACCPFHNEKTPSFSVSPTKGFYYCFGCHKGGSAVTFLMEHEGMGYLEAIRYLAKKCNVELPEEEESPEQLMSRQRKESLYLVSDFAAEFYASQLESGEGRAVGYSYFRSRGIEDATIRKFGLGWSPSDRQALIEAAKGKGYNTDYLVDTGVCVRTQDGRLYDRFHDRAVFPIYSDSGRVIAFGGRTLFSDYKERNIGKYINSPESEIYVKSRTLYGLYQAKSAIAKADRCILVEGNIDVISMHQLGICNTVASCGTSLTSDHVRRIKRFTSNLTIVYDGDSAGIKAADRGVDLALREGLDVKVVVLPGGQDPDDFCRSHTLEEVGAFLEKEAVDFVSFKAKMSLEAAQDDPIRRANVINEVADTIALIPDAVKRSVYIDLCSSLFEIDRESVRMRAEMTRNRISEEEWKRKRNEEQNRERNVASTQADRSVTVVTDGAQGRKSTVSETPLEPLERSLMEFLLNDGLIKMEFQKGHRFWCDPPMTVAEFIDSSLADDGLEFTVPAFKAAYDSYFHYYDEGLDKNGILRKMVQEQNPLISACVAALTSRRHEVTGEKIRSSMTSEQTIVLKGVPKALLLYRDKLLEQQELALRDKLRQPGADIKSLLDGIKQINENRRLLKKETENI